MSSSPPAADVPSLTDDGDDAKRNNIIHPPRSRDAGSGVEGDSRDTDADDTDADDSEDERELAEERRKEAEARAAWSARKPRAGRQARARVPCFRHLYLFASDPRGFFAILVGVIAGAPHPVGIADAPNPSARTPPPEPASPCVPTPQRRSVVRWRAGPTEARDAVLLVHGSSSTSFGFRALIDEIAARGHARSRSISPGSDSAPRAFPTAAASVRRGRGGAAAARAERLPPHHLVVAEDAAASASRTPWLGETRETPPRASRFAA